MKKLLISVFVFISCWAFSQVEIPEKSSKGTITTVVNTTIEYTNLRYSDGKINYTNAATGEEEFLYENSIKSIDYEPESQSSDAADNSETQVGANKPVYRNKQAFDAANNSKTQVEAEKKRGENIGGISEYIKRNYPEGIYNTKEDFINKTPSSNPSLVFTQLRSTKEIILPGEETVCFIRTTDDQKLKNVFAVSKGGYLYLNIKAILKNRERGNGDGSQETNYPNAYAAVQIGGDNFLYAEVPLSNAWGNGFFYSAVGGGVGVAIVTTGGMDYSKGVVFDLKKQNFDIFRNCEDFNKFLSKVAPDKAIICQTRHGYLARARRVMQEIK